MNRRWYGVPPLGGSASPDRLKPELQAVRGFVVPMHARSGRGLSMNRRWYGVPPLGSSASPDRLKPELHAVAGPTVAMLPRARNHRERVPMGILSDLCRDTVSIW